MGVRQFLILVVLFTAGLSCTQGHCRRKQDAPGVAKPVEADVPKVSASGPEARPTDRIMVYKYDGSLQCNAGKPISVEVMQKELAGIEVFSARKKPDGLMHIQVCGSITGMSNVYEIAAKDLKKAESKGFKKWDFQ